MFLTFLGKKIRVEEKSLPPLLDLDGYALIKRIIPPRIRIPTIRMAIAISRHPENIPRRNPSVNISSVNTAHARHHIPPIAKRFIPHLLLHNLSMVMKIIVKIKAMTK